MPKKQLQFSMKSGIGAVVTALLFIGINLLTIGESNDPELRRAVEMELRNEMAGMVSSAQENYDSSDEESVRDYIEATDVRKIKIYSIRVSKPIFAFSSDSTAVVKVDYKLPGPGKSRKSIYYSFKHSVLGGWTGGVETTSFSYYSNFF